MVASSYQPAGLQAGEQRADDLVRECHLAIVGGKITEALWRSVGLVRLVEVQEEEEPVRRQ